MRLFEFGLAAVDATKVEGVHIYMRSVDGLVSYEVRIVTTTQNSYTAYHIPSGMANAEDEVAAKFKECKELLWAIQRA